MILTGSQIVEEIETHNIEISPFDTYSVNPNSYNYRLGPSLVIIKDEVVDIKKGFQTETIRIPEEGYILQPNILYLGTTLESIGSTTYVPSLIGRASLGRLGLFLQITADLGNIGTNHCWTLELTVVQPLRIYSGMDIGQVIFWKPDGMDLLGGLKYIDKLESYAHYSAPQTSMSEKVIDDEL